MPGRSVADRIRDMIENIDRAVAFIGDRDEAAFDADQLVKYATIRALEIISEASRYLPQELRTRHPDADWHGIKNSGNVYRHGYDWVMPDRVWDTVTIHLAPLRTILVSELARLEAGSAQPLPPAPPPP